VGGVKTRIVSIASPRALNRPHAVDDEAEVSISASRWKWLGERPPDKRRAGRLQTEDTRCRLGQVLDLSITGMRVLHRGMAPRVGDEVNLTIKAPGASVDVRARVVRVVRTGFRKREVGLEFVALDPLSRERLLDLARYATRQLTLVA